MYKTPLVNKLIVDLDVIGKNYMTIRNLLPKNVAIGAAVKSDAYGHGVERVAKKLSSLGCAKFFVISLDEALELRKFSMTDEIYVFNGINDGEEAIFMHEHIIPVINSIKQFELFAKFARKKAKKLPIALYVDTGMKRMGLDIKELEIVLDSEYIRDISISSIISHLACSDESKHMMNEKQLKLMQHIREKYPRYKISLLNGQGILLGENYYFDMVRPGGCLYGYGVEKDNKILPVRSPLKFTSEIIHVTNIEEDGFVSYGSRFEVKKGMKIAVIPLGYADGYPRSLSNKGYCYLDRYKINIAGTVCMNHTMLDVSNVPERLLHLGAEIEIFGEYADIRDIANLGGTIAYELTTSIGHKYPKTYIG